MKDSRAIGRTADRVAGGVLLALFATGAVQASANGIEDVIAGCATQDAKDARIACLESELRRRADNDSGAAHAPSAPAEPAGQRPEALPVPPERPEQQAISPQSPIAQTEAARSDRLETSPAAEIPLVPEESRRPGLDDLGAEQVARRSAGRESADAPVRASVVSVNFVGYERLVVELDNGQIWRQTNGDRANVARDLRNEQTFEVEMRRTGLGGYRMYLVPLERTIRVERLK
jgi:hypothetical protein